MSEAYDAIKHDEESFLLKTYGRFPIAVDHGKGSTLWDVDGKEYTDLLAGIAVTGLGHCNDEVCDALYMQCKKLWHVSNLFYQEPQIELAKLLVSTAHFSKAFFCNSGAEANEAAIKLARRYMTRIQNKDASDIITLSSCFHGRTLGTLAATGRESLYDGFTPIPKGFKQVPAQDFQALEAAMDEHTCAVLLEVIQGEAGVLPLPTDYLQAVQKLCREKGVLFICDEVQAGMCRSGKFWAFQTCGLEPDIISIAKSLANGLPMGAILATEEAAKGFTTGSHATTFGGTAIVSSVAAKVIEIMLRDKLADRAAEIGTRFLAKARAAQAGLPEKILDVRGRGLMIGIDVADGTEVWNKLLEAGFITGLSHGTTLRLVPALTIEEASLDAFLEVLTKILQG